MSDAGSGESPPASETVAVPRDEFDALQRRVDALARKVNHLDEKMNEAASFGPDEYGYGDWRDRKVIDKLVNESEVTFKQVKNAYLSYGDISNEETAKERTRGLAGSHILEDAGHRKFRVVKQSEEP